MMKKSIWRIFMILLTVSCSIRAVAQQKTSPIILDSCSVQRFIPLVVENGKQSREGYTFSYRLVYPKALRSGDRQQFKKVLDLYKSKIFSPTAARETSILRSIEKEIEIEFQSYKESALETYQEEKKEARSDEPMYFLCFESTCEVMVRETEGNFCCFQINNMDYWGGAHGMYGTYPLLFDLSTLEQIQNKTLFRPGFEKQLNAIVKDCALIQMIKNRQKNAPALSAEERSDLESRDVKAHDTFYLDKKGITYVYNPYEIASYAEGLIEVFVPFDRVRALLKPGVLKHYFPHKYDQNNRPIR